MFAALSLDPEVQPVRRSAFAALAVPALLGGMALAVPASATDSATYVVQLAPSAAPVTALQDTLISRYGGSVRFTYTTALRGFAVTMPAASASRLAADPLVTAVTKDQKVAIVTTQSNAQYALDRIDQRTGLSGSYVYNATGAGVRVYGLDTGILPTHTDFGGRASIGFDAVGDGRNGIDCNGHGTHTAGSMAGAANGVAKAATLIGVRVLDCEGSGSSSGIIAGVDWVARNAVKPAVANMSLSSQLGKDSAIDTAVNGLINSGVTVAVAAGNGVGNGLYAQNACDISPANVPAALTVSATDRTDTKPIWANVGTCVDIFAPGVDVISDWYTSTTATSTSSGTSMSSPIVAGSAALYLQTNPSATPAQVASFLTSQATAGVVKSAGSGSPNRLIYTGGITAGGTPPANVAPTASYTYTTSGLSATFTDTSTDSDGTIASRSWNFGDGTTGTGTPVTRTYAAAGTYTVIETVTDNSGASASTSKAVTVGTTSDPDPATPNLTSGVAKSATSGAKGTWQFYKVNVPAAGKSVALTMTGPSCGLLSCAADLDLYGRNGSKPTTATYNCAAASSATTESCSISGAPAGYTYVGIYVYSGGSASYTVKATVT